MFLIDLRFNDMWNKALAENGGTLNSPLTGKKMKKMYKTLDFVSNCFKTQEICNKAAIFCC